MNNLHAAFHAVRQSIMPVLRTSEFMEKGVLTPDEFVAAGNQLISAQRVWRWGSGAAECRKSYLPPDMQYLVLSGAPCTARVASATAPLPESLVASGEEGDDWVCSGDIQEHEAVYEDLPEEDEYTDPAVAAIESAETTTTRARDERRFYTVYILYDNYYHTPRVYIKGHASSGAALSIQQMLEDVVQDYAGKTATLETHPHDPSIGACISIHPCRHASTMKRLLENSCSVSQTPTVESYMFFFLKFIASMIPTIEYDYTYGVGGGSRGR